MSARRPGMSSSVRSTSLRALQTRASTSGADIKSGDRTGFGLAALQECLRHIIPVPHAPLVGMARGAHQIAAIIEDQIREYRWRPGSVRRSIPGPWRWRRAERPGFQASSPVRCRAHLQRPTPCGFVDETWMANGAMLRRVGRPASIGPLSTLHPYQEDSHRRVEYRRSTKVDKAQGQALHNLRRSTAQK
jgi:hypothetical protein